MQPNVLATIADNAALSEALREVLLAEFTLVDGTLEGNRSDVQLGQMFRARMVGIQAIENALKKIDSYKTRKEIPRGINRAR